MICIYIFFSSGINSGNWRYQKRSHVTYDTRKAWSFFGTQFVGASYEKLVLYFFLHTFERSLCWSRRLTPLRDTISSLMLCISLTRVCISRVVFSLRFCFHSYLRFVLRVLAVSSSPPTFPFSSTYSLSSKHRT